MCWRFTKNDRRSPRGRSISLFLFNKRMPYRICKTFEIESGHMLSKHPDLCKFPHGHSRTVEVVLEADSLDRNEMVCDFKALTESLHEYLKTLDHAICVNTQDANFKQLRAAFGDRVVAFEALD